MMQRIQSAKKIVVTRKTPSRLRFAHSPEVGKLEELNQTVKGLKRASPSFQNLTTLVCPFTCHS